MNIEQRIAVEKQIVSRIVKDALALNCTVSVYDGEEWALKRSTKYTEVMGAIMSTDMDTLRFRNQDGDIVGSVFLVYGNDGYDVINDYSANAETEALLAGANALADKLEMEA